MSQRASSRLILAVFAVLLAAACGDSTATTDGPPASPDSSASDPWAETGVGFMDACTAGGDEAMAAFCRCAFSEVVEFYGTPEAFAAAEQGVAGDPDSLDPSVQAAFAGCAERHLVVP